MKYLPHIGLNNATITKRDEPTLSDECFHATLKSRKQYTTPFTKPLQYSDVWHMDIGFGPTAAIGGI